MLVNVETDLPKSNRENQSFLSNSNHSPSIPTKRTKPSHSLYFRKGTDLPQMVHERSAAACKPRHLLRPAWLRLLDGTQPRLGGRSCSFLGSARATLRLATNHLNHPDEATANLPSRKIKCSKHIKTIKRSGSKDGRKTKNKQRQRVKYLP